MSRFLVGRDPTGRAAESYRVAAMPTSVLLGRDGGEIARFEGGAESLRPAIESAVATALAGTAVVTDRAAAAAELAAGARKHMRAWERGGCGCN